MRTEPILETRAVSVDSTGAARSVRVPDGVLFREVGGEAVVLELETGHYYGLDSVGLEMWTLLSRHGDLQAVFQELFEQYDVEPERLSRDLAAFVDELVARRLLEIETP